MLRKKIIEAFIERQSRIYDLLYLYGQPWLTTKIVEELLSSYRVENPKANISRMDADSFREETFRKVLAGEHYTYPVCDLFILEHIEGVAGLEANEQRLYGILDWLLENNRQIVITGTVPTTAITNLAPRIGAQIDGGIAYSIPISK